MKLPERKSPRAKWHDYKVADYFVTISTKNNRHYFGTVRDGETLLTPVGNCLKKEIENTIIIREGEVEIPLYVIMPNHVHMIVSILDCKDAPRASANNVGLKNLFEGVLGVLDNNSESNNPCKDALRASTINNLCSESDARGASLQHPGFGPQSRNLGSVVRGIKAAVTHFARENDIPFAWHSGYYDRIVRNQYEMNRIAKYIEQNPAKWEFDRFYRNNEI